MYEEPDVLEAVGRQHTTIKSVSSLASKLEQEILLAVRDWFQHLPDKTPYITGESMEVAFALTLCMNRTREHPYTHFLSVPQWVGILRKFLCLTTASQDDPIYFTIETTNTIQKNHGRRFFTTEDRFIGTAPSSARTSTPGELPKAKLELTLWPGDSIYLLLGTYAPMVLRQYSSGSFHVVGECNVHGLTNAVDFCGPLPNNWRTIAKEMHWAN
jgi:hypothetical protein